MPPGQAEGAPPSPVAREDIDPSGGEIGVVGATKEDGLADPPASSAGGGVDRCEQARRAPSEQRTKKSATGFLKGRGRARKFGTPSAATSSQRRTFRTFTLTLSRPSTRKSRGTMVRVKLEKNSGPTLSFAGRRASSVKEGSRSVTWPR